MEWAYLVCLGGLFLATVLGRNDGERADLSRPWLFCCLFPVLPIFAHFYVGGAGGDAREAVQVGAFIEILGWVWVGVFLVSMKVALLPSASADQGSSA